MKQSNVAWPWQRFNSLNGDLNTVAQKIDRVASRTLTSMSWSMLFGCGALFAIAILLSPLILCMIVFLGLKFIITAIFRKARRGAQGDNEYAVMTRIGDKDYRITSDDNYLNQIEGRFEQDLVTLFSTLVKPADTILDIGANIGCTSILFGEKGQRVFSFEPSPTTFQFLEKNIGAAGLRNVQPVNVGLGNADGSFELTFGANNRAGGFVSNQLNASQGHQVERINIILGDSFVATNNIHRVDFIKIDVEGFERDVLMGMAATLTRDRPIVVLELNHWCLNAFQRLSVPDFFDFLRNVFPVLYAVEGSDVRNLHDNDQAYHVMYQHITRGLKYQNLVGAYSPEQLREFFRHYQVG